ncbi:unnamed protein product [Tetraodon nigroviridis]|uniref:Thioredoxin n=1 Tax=Tetraodon nigroviridis TaxID=99883 RepID=Q4S0R6_TETNG|nr:unnamed protein product [Tetraodon nigroviridis]
MVVIVIESEAQFDDYIKNIEGKLVVVDFTAQWCGPCKHIGPVFKSLSDMGDNKNVIFLKVDVDELEDLAARCKVSAMPTFLFFKDGVKIDEVIGANQPQLVEKIQKHKP